MKHAGPSRPWGRSVRKRISAVGLVGVALVAGLPMLAAHAASDETVAVPVPHVTINPGDVIRESQIVEKEFDARISKRDFYQAPSDVIGKVSRRVLLPGKPIPLAALKEAYLVSSGEMVRIVFTSNGLEVSGRALALQSGRRGEIVSCRNVDSGVVIRGVVTDTSLVELGTD